MKILSMTATFGKLEHETLNLEPGLNIFQAPNEWGKSTWCAFLVAMLYGIDTSERTTKTALANKEHYAPWSGSPMSGRIELNWNGRNITIERHTRGRLLLGEFRAYETDSGLDIPELTSSNCGQTLLGVERSVFLRAGFIRLSDLPVTQDDALRRRLNNLVTTGDENGAGDKLAQKLKDLKNKCRHNRTGLLPQAEAEQELLQRKLNQLQELNSQQEKAAARQAQLTDIISQLENHKATLEYEAARDSEEKVNQAAFARDEAENFYQKQLKLCTELPSQEEAIRSLQTAKDLQQQWQSLQEEFHSLPAAPVQPQTPEQYQKQAPEEIIAKAKADFTALQTWEQKGKKASRFVALGVILGCLLLLGLIFGLLFTDLSYIWLLSAPLLVCIGLAIFGSTQAKRIHEKQNRLRQQYSGIQPENWLRHAQNFAENQSAYIQANTIYQSLSKNLNLKKDELTAKINDFTNGGSLPETLEYWQKAVQALVTLENARKDYTQAQKYAEALAAMTKPISKPKMPDTLNASMADTVALLGRANEELQENRHRLGQLQGQAETLGLESDLRLQLKAIHRRISNLEDTYQALELALRALSSASSELQRRFAPKISKRAQELFCKLTGGRYPRLSLSEDLSLSAAADNEDVLRSSLWRSDGTADQLYLSLRLAVAEELTPEAPLILDDALVRFDDSRLAQALQILREEAVSKQILLFTCQSREKSLI